MTQPVTPIPLNTKLDELQQTLGFEQPATQPPSTTLPVDEGTLRAQVLQMAYQYGVVDQADLSMAISPPNLHLRYTTAWGFPEAQVAAWFATYGERTLHQTLETLKFLLAIHRLWCLPEPTSPRDRHLARWLLTVRNQRPQAFAELTQALDGVATEALQRAERQIQQAAPAQRGQAQQQVRQARIAVAQRWIPQQLQTGTQPIQLYDDYPLRFHPSEFVGSNLRAELGKMHRAELIAVEVPRAKAGGGRVSVGSRIYVARAGIDALRGSTPKKEMLWKEPGSYGLHITHQLGLNKFLLALQINAQRRGWQCKELLVDHHLRRFIGPVTVEIPTKTVAPKTGEITQTMAKLRLKYMDAYIDFDTQREPPLPPLLIEYDRANNTMESQSYTTTFADKIRTLQWWIKAGGMAARFPATQHEARGVYVLIVVEDNGAYDPLIHLESLRSTTEKVLGTQRPGGQVNPILHRYWFTISSKVQPSVNDYFANTVLEEAIWLRAGDDLGVEEDGQRPQTWRTLGEQ